MNIILIDEKPIVMKLLFSLLLLLLVGSCVHSSSTQEQGEEAASNYKREYWVNSLKVPCESMGPRQCLQIQQGPEMQPDQWKPFYDSLESFRYEEGFLYKLLVQLDSGASAGQPADLRYTVLEIMSKEPDPKLRLHDIWLLENMEEIPLSNLESPIQRPRLEFNLRSMQLIGFDGCNNLLGSILEIDATTLTLSPVAGTRKACPNMQVTDRFNALLSQVQAYTIEDRTLSLYNNQQQEVLSFRRAD